MRHSVCGVGLDHGAVHVPSVVQPPCNTPAAEYHVLHSVFEPVNAGVKVSVIAIVTVPPDDDTNTPEAATLH